MTINEKLIVQLILQDMRHQQLLSCMQRAGFDTSMHNLGILEIIAELKGRNRNELGTLCCDVYVFFLGQAANYKISGAGDELLPLAAECYQYLCICMDVEDNWQYLGRLREAY